MTLLSNTGSMLPPDKIAQVGPVPENPAAHNRGHAQPRPPALQRLWLRSSSINTA